MSLYFAAGLLASWLVMKTASLATWQGPSRELPTYFYLSPLFSVASYYRIRPYTKGAINPLLIKLVITLTGLTLAYTLYWTLQSKLQPPSWALAYLAAPIVLMLGELGGVFSQLCFLPSGHVIPPHHASPILARSVAEFWGRRWNRWVSDWMRQVLFARFRNEPALGVFLTFIFSGVWHELLINLPLYFLTGRNLFGMMICYFLIQAVGLSLERYFTKPFRRAFAWIVIFAPLPLVVNEGLLRICALWP